MKNKYLSLLSSLLLVPSIFGASLSSDILDNSLIVYNGSIALVHETRDLHVNKNDTKIIYEGIANTIETDSVNVQLPSDLRLLSQQFRFDKLTRSKLLDAHIDKEVGVRVLKDLEHFEILKATLLANDAEHSIVRTSRNEIISVLNSDVIFATIPTELITQPSLVWNIDAKKNFNTTMSIDYLIKNVDWKSDYILNLDGDMAELSGWITIDNRSGKRFENIALHLLAGEINRAHQSEPYYRNAKAMAMYEAAPSVAHQAHEGYHFYSIPFKVTLANNEKTQIKFISQNNLHVNRRYSATLSNPAYLQSEIKQNVDQYVHLEGFDFPLPKGIVRTYSKSSDKNILLGETTIGHTAKDTPMDLLLGKNFDLKVTQTPLNRNDDKYYYDATIRYTLQNSSNENKKVTLQVPFQNSKSNTIDTPMSYQFQKGNLVTFTVVVNAENSESFEVQFRSKK